MNNRDLSKLLEETGILVRLAGGNDFKAAAWDRSARTIEALENPIASFIASGTVESIDGIGKSIAKEIYAYGESGTLPRLELLKEELPDGLIEWLNISGLGPKKIYKIHQALEISTIEELKEKCRDGSVAELKGMGKKSADKILTSIDWMEKFSERCLLTEAETIAQTFVASLESQPGVQQLSIAGSLRRRLETIGDIDLLIAADEADAPALFESFVGLEAVTEILGKGDTKSSVRTKEGRQVDLRIVKPSQFAAALMYFTGNKDHNVAMRQRARKRGMALNEYGLFQLDEEGQTDFDHPVAYESEADLYRLLELHFVPPELREHTGEESFFEENETADLVELSDLRGVLHAHSTWSDGKHTIEEMARACIKLGYEYLGITDHSRSAAYAGGLTIEQVVAQWEEIDALNALLKKEGHAFRVFKGIESDILIDGSLDYPEEVLEGFDFIIASVHSSLDMKPDEMLERFKKAAANPYCTMIGHPTGRLLLKRKGNDFDMNTFIEFAAEQGTAIEINANPLRLDLDWRYGNKMRSCELMSSINPDAHNQESIGFMKFGVDTARKARLSKSRILNSRTLNELEMWLADH